MIGELVKSTYRYKNVELNSGAKINANEVSCSEGKVVSIPNADVEVSGENFNFSVRSYSANGKRTRDLNSVPESIDGEAIVKEFIDFVEADIL